MKIVICIIWHVGSICSRYATCLLDRNSRTVLLRRGPVLRCPELARPIQRCPELARRRRNLAQDTKTNKPPGSTRIEPSKRNQVQQKQQKEKENQMKLEMVERS